MPAHVGCPITIDCPLTYCGFREQTLVPVEVANFITCTKTGVSMRFWAGWKDCCLQLFVTALSLLCPGNESSLSPPVPLCRRSSTDGCSLAGTHTAVRVHLPERQGYRGRGVRAMRCLGWLGGSAASRTACLTQFKTALYKSPTSWLLLATEPSNVLANKGFLEAAKKPVASPCIGILKESEWTTVSK